MSDPENFVPPPVRDMTEYTGSGKNEHRRTVLIGYSVSRQAVAMIIVGVITFAITAVPLALLGLYGLLIACAITAAVLFALFYRVKRSMGQRAYKALKDYLASEDGTIFIDGRPVLDPVLVYHHPLLIDRDPSEFKDTDIAYVTPPSRTSRSSSAWLTRSPNKATGKAYRR